MDSTHIYKSKKNGTGVGFTLIKGYNNRSATALSAFSIDPISTNILTLSLATQCRQLTNMRMARVQGSLPVVPLTILTLWSRVMHTLLTYTPQNQTSSHIPLLRLPRSAPATVVAAIRSRRLSTMITATAHEHRIKDLASDPSTLQLAIKMYRDTVPSLPLSSTAPWMLLAKCADYNNMNGLEWMVKSLRVLRGFDGQSTEELLICAYMYLGEGTKLRDYIKGLCVRPVALHAAVLTSLFIELQGTSSDIRLACSLWDSLIGLPDFSPSKTCTQLALKFAMHNRSVKLAVATYQMVLSGRWNDVTPGDWAINMMVYGLAINGMTREAFEVASATTEELLLTDDNEKIAQALFKYELLLKGLRNIAPVDEVEAIFDYVRSDLGLRPNIQMYMSILVLLANKSNWDNVRRYIDLMVEDGYSVPDSIWGKLLYGFAKQGQVNTCDDIINFMMHNNIRLTYKVILGAVCLQTQLGNLEVILRWYRVIHNALAAYSQRSKLEKQAVNIDGSLTHSSLDPYPPVDPKINLLLPEKLTLARPEDFAAYFIENNELIWDRTILEYILNAIGNHGTPQTLMQVWSSITQYQDTVSSLTLSPKVYMAFVRALTNLGALNQFQNSVIEQVINNRRFSYTQREEVLGFIRLCTSGRLLSRMEPRAARVVTTSVSDAIKNAVERMETSEEPDTSTEHDHNISYTV